MLMIMADYLMHALHLSVIAANLLGWIPRATRRAHRYLAAVTTICWLGIGWAVGSIGYCPLTDWHWQIKRALGQRVLPHSYIDYLLQSVGLHFNPNSIDIAVGLTFGSVLLITMALAFKQPNNTRIKR